ncbi:MAG: helix-turn-helix domain-containing protein [Verrucomicrobia bacterium]|nr:helix-turn-helix domain-containing protein [Verrucomicrobiota bacterium]MBU4290180.1 helix-turn-helix domain-containing protein [Verrucomicrobiota bacterium]MBU4427775.1 helix-turn-helix domain-containing protein [Verrucomicrobiota bacterium]MBU4497926.1 helix-turn-helix domain-containing protein [Verrucomicrobiota bacterium]MCG2681692.1 helix-turn-helix domain-containing protein [Kiritimatiellia bacterium]
MVTWLSIDDLAHYLKTPKSTLYKLLSSGRLSGHKVGRNYRFDRDEIDELVKRGALSRRIQEHRR